MAVLDGKLYISAPPLPSANFIGFDTLWVSDGTTAGTMPIAGVPVSATSTTLAVYQGKLYFSVDNSLAPARPALGHRWHGRRDQDGRECWAPTSATITQLLAAGPNLYIFTSSHSPPTAAMGPLQVERDRQGNRADPPLRELC